MLSSSYAYKHHCNPVDAQFGSRSNKISNFLGFENKNGNFPSRFRDADVCAHPEDICLFKKLMDHHVD